ncbi:MAG: hypothetical protein GTN89_08605 [Acidobacteria bacterium]|nr:hypothetical protein [Acidobacteriota bacterium]NIM63974.1 hypothetical protein [Acidobacteriota bacterium]NIO59379.1 hypothetical protein [Acidobacteriota bacterium]NIQ30415.1 hypothetical protein [Acidobacteriota bacterium]NIQ85341.1 hypothetical protein [Acidobacteriota bacterium]
MPRFLRTFGILVLAGATILLVAGEAGVVARKIVDVWFMPVAQAGALALAIGVLLSLLAPFARMVRQGRCVRCGASIEKSQTYCHDHLKTAVQEFRDHRPSGY